MKHRLSLIIWLGALIALLPVTTFAATFLQKNDQELFISNPIDDDVYAAAKKISVREVISGDAVLGGRVIEIESTIEQDLFAGGQDVRLLGTVGDDAHLAGNKVRINGDVTEDLFAGGQEIELMSGSTVGKDAYLAGDIIKINGTISGTVRVAGDTISLGKNAVIEGDLISYGGAPVLEEGASVLGQQEHRVQQDQHMSQRTPVNRWVRATLASLAIVLLIIWLMPRKAQAILDDVKANPTRNILTGAVWLLLYIPVTVIIAVTIVGLPLAFILSGITLTAYIVATGLAALFIGHWVYNRLSPGTAAQQSPAWIPAVLGAALYEGIQMLGFLGWFATFILVLFIFGAIVQTIWRSKA